MPQTSNFRIYPTLFAEPTIDRIYFGMELENGGITWARVIKTHLLQLLQEPTFAGYSCFKTLTINQIKSQNLTIEDPNIGQLCKLENQ